jgi:hypothetical protein
VLQELRETQVWLLIIQQAQLIQPVTAQSAVRLDCCMGCVAWPEWFMTRGKCDGERSGYWCRGEPQIDDCRVPNREGWLLAQA